MRKNGRSNRFLRSLRIACHGEPTLGEYLNCVVHNFLVNGDKRRVFNHCLSDEHAVELIAMMHWKVCRCQCVCNAYGQDLEMRSRNSRWKHIVRWER